MSAFICASCFCLSDTENTLRMNIPSVLHIYFTYYQEVLFPCLLFPIQIKHKGKLQSTSRVTPFQSLDLSARVKVRALGG